MRRFAISFAAVALLSACSETPLEEQNETEIAETEKQIEADAKSLEEAADEAVKTLEAEIDAELADEGVSNTTPPPPATDEPIE